MAKSFPIHTDRNRFDSRWPLAVPSAVIVRDGVVMTRQSGTGTSNPGMVAKFGSDCCCGDAGCEACCGTGRCRCRYLNQRGAVTNLFLLIREEHKRFFDEGTSESIAELAVTQNGKSPKPPDGFPCSFTVPVSQTSVVFAKNRNGIITADCTCDGEDSTYGVVIPEGDVRCGGRWTLPGFCPGSCGGGEHFYVAYYHTDDPDSCLGDCNPQFGAGFCNEDDCGTFGCPSFRFNKVEFGQNSDCGWFDITDEIPLASCNRVDRQLFFQCSRSKGAWKMFYVWQVTIKGGEDCRYDSVKRKCVCK